MPCSFRRSRSHAGRAAPLVLTGVFWACNFPNYAFQRDPGTEVGGAGSGGTPSNAGAAAIDGGAGGMAAGTFTGGTAGSSDMSGGGLSGAGTGGGTAGGTDGGATAGGGDSAIGGSGGAGGAGGGAGGSGSLLFSDDFEAGNASSWSPSAAADWSVVSAGSQVYKQGTKGDALRVSSAGDANWTDQALEVRVKVLTFGGSTTSDLALIAVRFRDADDFYYAALRADGKVVLKARLNGVDSSLTGSVSAGIAAGTWYTVRVVASGSTLSLYLDGTLQQSVAGVLIASGSVALGSSNATAEFDDVRVTVP
jgi:hypothetical protein